jgi:hypothetical protein
VRERERETGWEAETKREDPPNPEDPVADKAGLIYFEALSDHFR